jgi:hypothetical protein
LAVRHRAVDPSLLPRLAAIRLVLAGRTYLRKIAAERSSRPRLRVQARRGQLLLTSALPCVVLWQCRTPPTAGFGLLFRAGDKLCLGAFAVIKKAADYCGPRTVLNPPPPPQSSDGYAEACCLFYFRVKTNDIP